MTRILFLAFFFGSFINVFAGEKKPLQSIDTLQSVHFDAIDQKAKIAVGKIMQYTGLPQNFIIVNEDVRTAVAYIKNRKRYIAYNDDFIKRILDETQTDWSAVSILAHELAHHLAGHTINIREQSPGDELECDIFSGFILYRMGATMEEANVAMEKFVPDTTNKIHPPKSARLQAIKTGWLQAKALDNVDAAISSDAVNTKKEVKMTYELTLTGDDNLYFIDDNDRVIWFDNYGTPIVIGMIKEPESKSYQWTYSYQDKNYGVDFKGKIWRSSNHGAMAIIGQVFKIIVKEEEE